MMTTLRETHTQEPSDRAVREDVLNTFALSALAKGGALMPGEGRSVWLLGVLHTTKITGAETGGAFAVCEQTALPGGGPPPHIHQCEDEAFFVLEGAFSFLCGDQSVTAGPGTFVYVPKGTLHTFKNVGETTGRFLCFLSPAGFEQFFDLVGTPVRDLEEALALPEDPAVVERLLSLAPQFHLEVPPPPSEA